MTGGNRPPYKCILSFSPVTASIVAVGEAGKIESLMNGRSIIIADDSDESWLVLREKEASEGLYEEWRKFVDIRSREGGKFWITYNEKRVCLVDNQGNCLNEKERKFMGA